MVDNMPRGDPGRPPQALSPGRPQPGPQESPYLDAANICNGNSPMSPSRSGSDDFDFQQSNISLLKAQLKLVTHERDMLKKDVKKISMERDGAYKHLSLTTGSGQMEFAGHHHHRTASDTASATSSSGKLGHSSNLSRSHSIASAGDKSLILSTAASPPSMHPLQPQMSRHGEAERLLHELQMTKKQHGDALKKAEQSMKDAEYYHVEAESMRTRYNEIIVEKQRLEQEVNSLRLFMEEDRKEMAELRRQQQDVLSAEGGPGESLSIMYGTLLQNYEAVKDDYTLVRKRYDDLVASHSAAVSKLEHSQEEIMRYKKLYQEVLTERNQLKQQCTQAIRQWDQALRERNECKDALAKVQRQHDEAIKEINQAMTVRIKASKDLKRLTEERNAAMQEYTLIMSERDSVHKEIEKLQEEIQEKNKKMSLQESRTKLHDDDRRKLVLQIEMLKREIEQSLHERDKAMKEAHELREKVGGGKSTADYEHKSLNKNRYGDTDKHKKDRDSASTETIDNTGSGVNLSLAGKKERLENLDQANAEIEKLRKLGEKLTGELQDAGMEADVAKGRRDWAFSERDKVVLERESIRTLCDKLRRERDRAVSELAEALRDSDDVKKERNETVKENKDLREKLDAVEKGVRMKALQRSPGHSHSHDSAIDSDLQEWETEHVIIDMNGLGSQEDLALDLSGGRDDIHCPAEKPIYISSIGKGSFLDGKLKVNDCILRLNNIDCRDIDRGTVLHMLKSSTSTVSLLIRRRKIGRRYNATLHLGVTGADHGLTLEMGAYVAKIQPGSAAAKEGSIAVGDRIISINDQGLDHIEHIGDADKLLNAGGSVLSLTLAKSTNALSTIGPLSSSSSGHNMQEKLDDDQKVVSPKSLSAATSPIKDTIRGSQEFVKKLMSSGQKERHSGLSSSSSEKVYQVTKASSKESKSPFGLMETVKEKFDTVRGRRRSKDPTERQEQTDSREAIISSSREHSEHDLVTFKKFSSHSSAADKSGHEELVLAELDCVLNSYNSGSSGTKSSGTGKKKRSKQDRDSSFKSGGTWPRTRGGPIIDHGTGTILHPQKMKKERLPLVELLTNLPKYPPDNTGQQQVMAEKGSTISAAKVPYRSEDSWARSTRDHTRRSRPVTTYDTLGSYAPTSMTLTASAMMAPVSRQATMEGQLEIERKVYLSPSDTSIDDSVKSAQAGKEVLERYLKKTNKTSLSSMPAPTSTDVMSPLDPPVGSPPPALTLASSGMALYQSAYTAALKSAGGSEYLHHPIGGTSSPLPLSQQLVRPSASGFSPYYYPPPSTQSTHPHIAQHHHLSSSPRYSTPPPPGGGDSMLGSPIPDYRAELHQRLYHHNPYESTTSAGPQQPTSSQPHSMSPTPGLYLHGHSHSPSPGTVEYTTTKSRGQLVPHPPPPSSSSHQQPYSSSSGGLAYPTSGHNYFGSMAGHTTSSAMTHMYSQGLLTQSYHLRPAEETSPPPLYPEYVSSTRRVVGKENEAISSRIRIPSNTSVASHGSASTDRPLPNCASPSPIYSVQFLLPDGILPDGRVEHQRIPRKPSPGDIRQIYIEKSSEALGITIDEGATKKGVFVSSVSENSLASQVGLQVGDQLLDVCGLNLRACGKEQAALVLHQVGNCITMKVQYNPVEYHSMLRLGSHDVDEDDEEENVNDDEDSSDESESDDEGITSNQRRSQRGAPSATGQNAQEGSRSGTPTPRNSPKGSAGRHPQPPPGMVDSQFHSSTLIGALNVSLPPSAHSTLTRHHINQVTSALHARSSKLPPYEPRIVFPVMKKSGDLGVRLVGGNAVGIFIHSVEIDSAAYQVGLRSADQILEYNGVDLRLATAEQAAYELAKPAEKVSILVQYNPEKYEVIKDQPGDSYFVRAMFDRLPDHSSDPSQLSFRKDDILFVDNTMYNGVPGHWSAWLVDMDGKPGQWGIVPSKYKVEEELLMKRSMDTDSDLGIGSSSGASSTISGPSGSSRRTWTTTRRSFFKRRKGGRSSSRDSSAAKELASYSDVASLNYSDSGTLHEVEPPINSYIRVERLDYLVTRPVLIIGPLGDVVLDKLVSDYPHKFARCEPEYMNCNQEALEKGIINNILVDFKRRGSHYECTTVSAIKDICDRNQHCILNVHLESVERLHHNQIYPIVLLIKFKSVKQIKEIKDPRYLAEKISQKDAKNIFEHTQKLEAEYKPLITDTIHAGANLMLMCAQIASKIDQEQNKTLWVPSGTIW